MFYTTNCDIFSFYITASESNLGTEKRGRRFRGQRVGDVESGDGDSETSNLGTENARFLMP
jgi:hypothetical protein